MSDNHANEPPLDTRLPDELARCESILTDMPLPRSRVLRDELLYRAGWAAAEVEAKSLTLRAVEGKPTSRSTRRRSTFVWSVASAAIAASLAVAMTLRLQPAASTPADAVVSLSHTDGFAIGREGNPPPGNVANLIRVGFTTGTGVGGTASLLIMRDRALLQQWDDPWIVTETSVGEWPSDDGMPSQPVTSREMLQEFLPGPSAQDTLDRDSTWRMLRWPWKSIRLGDTT